MILKFDQLSTQEKQSWLQHVIAPRPICFASTINEKGEPNLSPFSFFNMFSSNPPILIFSAARRLRDNSTKHTLENVMAVPECVVNIVDHDMVQQTSLASCDYPKGVDEFEKSGFNKEPATLVRPFMVKEAKVKLECKIIEVKPLGKEAGAGNLIIAEVLCMHVSETILGEDGKIDQEKLNLVARLGGDWYCKVDKQNLFTVPKPNQLLGMGIDALPMSIKNSPYLTGNHLGMLANLPEIPAINPGFEDDTLKNIIGYFSINPTEMEKELHQYAASLLNKGDLNAAWQVLLS